MSIFKLKRINKGAIKFNPLLFLLAVLYGIGLYFFYLRYVPLMRPFQAAFLPILCLVFIITALNKRWGLLFFVFSFPLINNLPYFFGIHEPLPHAPSALVLFLVFFFGLLVNKALSQERLDFNHPVFRPLLLFSLFITISAVITFWRYTNFFPFRSDYIYELITNTIGVTAGGAIMSVIFFSLNYLTGIAFFLILFNLVKSWDFIKTMLIFFCSSTFLSLAFGLFQRCGHVNLGNNPLSISGGMVNATFKDALSFGAYIAITTPVIFSGVFIFKKAARFFCGLVAILALYMIFFTGSRSGLICLIISLLIFLSLLTKQAFDLARTGSPSVKNIIAISLIILIIILAGLSLILALKENIKTTITVKRLGSVSELKRWESMLFSRSEGLWKAALLMVKDYPFTGVGVGGYIIEAANYARKYNLGIGVPESAENYLLQVGAELGAIGLFFVLWIFLEILKQMRRGYQRLPASDKKKALLFGAMAGVVAFFINIQYHTYIGSYEIKYTFWLLAGLIFCLERIADIERAGNRENASEQRVIWSKDSKLLSIIFIFFFSLIHFWNSTHSLSLKSRTEEFGLEQNFGFYEVEKTKDGREFRWTRSYGGLTLKIEKPVMSISLLASHPDIMAKPVKVKIIFVKDFFREKKLLKELILDRNIWQNFDLYIPEEVGEEVILLFKVDRTWNPLKVHGTPDPRNLGVAIGKIEFRDL